MDARAMASYILDTFPRVEATEAYGYEFFFYADERKLPFATLACSDNDYDRVSNLDRPGVFRLNIGVSRGSFQDLFGSNQIDVSSCDFTDLDKILPHPEYSAQNFVCVLNPEKTWETVQSLLAEAYSIAARRHERRQLKDSAEANDSA